MEEKRCTKCKKIKDFNEFSTDNSVISGKSARCKFCSKMYYKENKSILLGKAKIYYENNKESINKATKKYRQNNKEKYAAYSKLWANNNKSKVKDCRKKSAAKPSSKMKKKISNKKYEEQHKEENKEYRKKLIESMADDYIIKLLKHKTSLTSQCIKQYPELIEAKRAQIKLKRQINEQVHN